MDIEVRLARPEDLDAVQALRRQVNDVHVQGRPDFFRPGFGEALQQHLYDFVDQPDAWLLVALADGQVAGFASANRIHKPETPYRRAMDFYHVDEFCVDEAHRRQGVATALIDFIKRDAAAKGLDRVELDVWEFNQGAVRFYEAAGFKCYRRYMELMLGN